MKTIFSLLLTLCLGFLAVAQNPLLAFDHLVNKTWKTDTQWENKNAFFQEVTFEYALDSSLVITKTKGHINKEQTQIGERNFGVRQYDQTKKAIYFVEYDIFGGKTEGFVRVQNKNLIYTYTYGNVELTEKWIYINPTTYTYKIGIWKDGTWETLYLESQFNQVINK